MPVIPNPAKETPCDVFPMFCCISTENGAGAGGASGKTIAVLDPATEEAIGTVAHADKADLDEALPPPTAASKQWRAVSPFDRAKVMQKAAALMRERADTIAPLMVQEQGEDAGRSQDGDDGVGRHHRVVRRGRRAVRTGRIIPARLPGGLPEWRSRTGRPGCAAFTPWNFPINQVVRKLSCGAGMPVARSSSRRRKRPRHRRPKLIRAFVDAGVPPV